jgi:hypothetical protein
MISTSRSFPWLCLQPEGHQHPAEPSSVTVVTILAGMEYITGLLTVNDVKITSIISLIIDAPFAILASTDLDYIQCLWQTA